MNLALKMGKKLSTAYIVAEVCDMHGLIPAKFYRRLCKSFSDRFVHVKDAFAGTRLFGSEE